MVILRYSGVTLSVVSGSLVQSSGSPFTDSSTGDTISVFTSGDGLIKFT